jgi:cytochrome c-type biogenesis protein
MDVASTAYGAMTSGSLWAVPAVTVVGVVAGVSPCAAPRSAVLAAVARSVSNGRFIFLSTAFTAGLAACYAALGLLGSRFAAMLNSPYVYGVLAVCLIATGVRSIVLTTSGKRCVRHAAVPAGAAFAFGSFCAATASPCCTPLILPLLAYAAQSGRPALAAALLGGFAFGHAIPTIVTALIASRSNGRGLGPFASITSTVGGAVMIALGGYYGLLA